MGRNPVPPTLHLISVKLPKQFILKVSLFHNLAAVGQYACKNAPHSLDKHTYMNLSQYELRERYKSLDTKNLIAVYLSGGLTDLAEKLIVEELKRRNINSRDEAIQHYKHFSESFEISSPRNGSYWGCFWTFFIPAFLYFIKSLYETFFK